MNILTGLLNLNRTVPQNLYLSMFKDSWGLQGRRTSNADTTYSDLLLAGITQLAGVLLAKAVHKLKYARCIRKLAA